MSSYQDTTETDKVNQLTNVPKVRKENNLIDGGNILLSLKKFFLRNKKKLFTT